MNTTSPSTHSRRLGAPIHTGFAPRRLAARDPSTHATRPTFPCTRRASRLPLCPSNRAVSTPGSSASVSSRGSLASGSLDEDPTPPPPPLSAQQAAALTALQAGNVYGLGIVSSPSDLAARLRTDTIAGLSTVKEGELQWRQDHYGTNTLPAPTSVSLWQLIKEALDVSGVGVRFWGKGSNSGGHIRASAQ